MIIGAIALGIQTLAGHAEFTYYTLLIMALYAIWRWGSVTLGAWRAEHSGCKVSRG